ncbi:MarR family transcriptional regulator [soil metagenome]
MSSPVAPPPLLEDQLCFDLFTASEAVVGAYEPELSQLGLTYHQYLVLLVLWEHGTLSKARLARELKLSVDAVAPIVRRLVANGLLSRTGTGVDGEIVVALTPKAEAMQDAIYVMHCHVKDALGLTGKEFRELQSVLRNIVKASDTLSAAKTSAP